MSNGHFDSTSNDSMFATILARLDADGRKTEEWRELLSGRMDEMLIEARRTNGRISKLESWREGIKAQFAVIVALGAVTSAIAGWAIQILLR